MRIDGVGVPYDGSVTESKFANPESVHASYMYRQALINSNFDVWRNGTSFTNPQGFTADKFGVSLGTGGSTMPSSIVHSRITLTPGELPGSFYAYRISPNAAGSGFGANNFYLFQQDVANGVRNLCGAGRKVSVSFYARSSIPGKKIGLNTIQFYGSGGSPSSPSADTIGNNFTLTSSWQKCEVILTTTSITDKTFGTDNNDVLTFRMGIMWGSNIAPQFGATGTESFGGSGDIDIAQVQLCSGDVVLPYDPKTPSDELDAIVGGISGKIVPSNSDMNALLATGIYYSDTASGNLVNGPNQGSDSAWWELQVSVTGTSTSYFYQILKMSAFEYSRYKLGGGAFTAWARTKTFGKTTIDSSDFNNTIPTQAVSQADSTATDVAGLLTDFNALLTKLKNAKLMA